MDSLVAGSAFDDVYRAEDLHLYVDRRSLHDSLLSRRGREMFEGESMGALPGASSSCCVVGPPRFTGR
jgi:hypothetical protein